VVLIVVGLSLPIVEYPAIAALLIVPFGLGCRASIGGAVP
jgi:hypothetical protein